MSAAYLPWETDSEQYTARQDTWLLSFIDILALLLTLFVLLLAFNDRTGTEAGSEPEVVVALSPDFFSLLAVPGSMAEKRTTQGFAMPGNGLIPVSVSQSFDAVSDKRSERPLADSRSAATADAPDTDTVAVTSVAKPERAKPPAAVTPVDAATETAAPSDDETMPPQADTAAPSVADGREAAALSAQPEAQPQAATRQTADTLLRSLQASELSDRVEVIAHRGAVSLEIRDSILFAPASAALSDAGLALLGQLADILRTLPYSVSVEGHTDNVPIHTPVYPSNWELSSARAAMVTRKLIEQGIAAERLRAVGYGDTRPRSDNTTAQQRAANRRVSFVLQVEDTPKAP